MILVDRKINFTDRKKLKTLYIGLNVFIFGLFQYTYGKMIFTYEDYEILFINIKKYYFIIVATLGLVLFVLETIKTRNLKTSFVPLITSVLYLLLAMSDKLFVIVVPVALMTYITKTIVGLFYPNIKLNYILAYDLHLENGKDNLNIKGPFNLIFYDGDFFETDILNKIYTFFTSSYILKTKRKIMIYGSQNIDNQYNLMTIVEHYERLEDGFVVFNNIELSTNNRYEKSDVFQLDEVTEIADGEFFKTYLASQILSYPRVDFEYKIYIVDLSIIKAQENFVLFDINQEQIKEVKIKKNYSIKMENLKDDDKISNFLNKLVEKQLIYNEIKGYLSKGPSDEYMFDRTENFRLKYDAGIKSFQVYSEKMGLIGRLDKEITDEIVNINLPVKDNIVFEDEGDKDGVQVYGLFEEHIGEEKPYDMNLNFFVQVKFPQPEGKENITENKEDIDQKIEEQETKEVGNRPEFNLIAVFDLELSI